MGADGMGGDRVKARTNHWPQSLQHRIVSLQSNKGSGGTSSGERGENGLRKGRLRINRTEPRGRSPRKETAILECSLRIYGAGKREETFLVGTDVVSAMSVLACPQDNQTDSG